MLFPFYLTGGGRDWGYAGKHILVKLQSKMQPDFVKLSQKKHQF